VFPFELNWYQERLSTILDAQALALPITFSLGEGFLLWLGERGNIIHVLAANGFCWTLQVPGNTRLLSLVKGADDRIHFFGDKTHGQLRLDGALRPWDGIHLPHALSHNPNHRHALATGPSCAVATRDGSVMGSTSAGLFEFSGENRVCNLKREKSPMLTAAAWDEVTDMVVAIEAGNEKELILVAPGISDVYRPELPKGSRPQPCLCHPGSPG